MCHCWSYSNKISYFFPKWRQLSPKIWLGKSSIEDVKQWIFQLEDKSRHTFRAYRGIYIAEKLKEVHEEQMTNKSKHDIHDFVNIAAHNVNENNVCFKRTADMNWRYENALIVITRLISMILVLMIRITN